MDFQRAAHWHNQEAQRPQALGAVQSDIGKSGNFEPLNAVTVTLKDMHEAVARMANNIETRNTAMRQINHRISAMPNMAVDMHRMNIKTGMVKNGVDSTMGRMAPWQRIQLLSA